MLNRKLADNRKLSIRPIENINPDGVKTSRLLWENKILLEEAFYNNKKDPPFAFFDSLLLGEWEDRVERGLFRYNVTASESLLLN
uniref:GDP-L-galactose phosphorylase 2 n=1 Tax=Tanacetum cinerariifolium TaxID=118510 RepID=A0A6L2MEF9_TANCI|nr:GDP-L-galactose phosphorylase 2 [Tanacetum cinerariifolium]